MKAKRNDEMIQVNIKYIVHSSWCKSISMVLSIEYACENVTFKMRSPVNGWLDMLWKPACSVAKRPVRSCDCASKWAVLRREKKQFKNNIQLRLPHKTCMSKYYPTGTELLNHLNTKAYIGYLGYLFKYLYIGFLFDFLNDDWNRTLVFREKAPLEVLFVPFN